MLVQMDLCLQQVLTEELATLRADGALVEDVFAGLPREMVRIIVDTFATISIPVKLGYPREVTELPGVFLVLGSTQEEEQPIGEIFDEQATLHSANGVPGAPIYWTQEAGTFMRSTLRACCWTENANHTVWLQNAVIWSLLRRRDDLSAAGLIEQRLGASDFEPLPRWFPSFVYRRDVMLTAKHPALFSSTLRPIAAVQATQETEGELFTARIERH